ncbi:BrnA antitoxin family protein [Rhodoferax sp.]|uniref:BrnA antitoxin family protein n=1 Tax=Rhodoferax sp. TaxID=50421 RepID=UPI0027213C0C|nr:BrnA antitoxin family protein [Rhodoferax sp.]MDO8318723.1 BrnA antitoxin family protein [Rhodoferax sp.]MDP2677675.1 BrnA antitoxin family protein [Rhodoferax sp.]
MHTTDMIAQYKTRGRPVGTRKADTKQAVTVRYSPDVLAAFKATGPGWKARMIDALREWLGQRTLV